MDTESEEADCVYECVLISGYGGYGGLRTERSIHHGQVWKKWGTGVWVH